MYLWKFQETSKKVNTVTDFIFNQHVNEQVFVCVISHS
jgi:hypothetical protein